MQEKQGKKSHSVHRRRDSGGRTRASMQMHIPAHQKLHGTGRFNIHTYIHSTTHMCVSGACVSTGGVASLLSNITLAVSTMCGNTLGNVTLAVAATTSSHEALSVTCWRVHNRACSEFAGGVSHLACWCVLNLQVRNLDLAWWPCSYILHTYIHTHTHIYIYIYYVCTHTRTHTHSISRADVYWTCKCATLI